MKVTECSIIRDYIDMADEGWKQGWHERNGGNLSYRLQDDVVKTIKDEFSPRDWSPIGASVPGLKNEYFVVTGTGRYFRNIARHPEESIGIIELDDKGENYRIVWGYEGGGRPTSELPSHLMNLEVKKSIDPDMRIVYHAHTPALISLSFLMEASDEKYTRELWEMMPECAVVFPEGIGVLPFMVPGGEEIAIASSNKMKIYNLILWAHHGVFASGKTFDETFGLMHTAEKAADMLLRVMAAGGKKITMSDEDLRAIAKRYDLELDERFLYKK